MIKNWIFANPTRLRQSLIALATVLLFAFIGLGVLRATNVPPHSPTPTVSTPDYTLPDMEPDVTSTDLVPPSPTWDEPSPTADYGSSAPVALEAVSAFLRNDAIGFAKYAQPEAVEGANEAPARPAGQKITGSTILLDGPTRQQVQVRTSEGPLILDMAVVDGKWRVLDMVYQK